MHFRFEAWLPYVLAVPTEPALTPFRMEFGGYEAIVHPPYRSALRAGHAALDAAVPIVRLPRLLHERDPDQSAGHTTFLGAPAIEANAVCIDIAISEGAPKRAELVDAGLAIVNQLLLTMRGVLHASWVRPIRKTEDIWIGTFVNDAEDDESIDGRSNAFCGVHQMRHVALAPEAWTELRERAASYEPSSWEVLLLDARRLAADSGPALVLAVTAIETCVAAVLITLGYDPNAVSPNPRTATLLDVEIRNLAGVSLKDDQNLWQRYRTLQKARNSFVHRGAAVSRGEPVGWEQCMAMITDAGDIVDWLLELLPVDRRRRLLVVEPNRWTMKLPVFEPTGVV